jgi:hypothetical protein
VTDIGLERILNNPKGTNHMKIAPMVDLVNLSSTIVAAKDQIGCDLGGEEVILDLNSGIYYGLNAVGASIWKLIQEPITVSEIRKAIFDEYDVDSERCENDVVRLLNELAERNLINVCDTAN